ncbi:hypothetical protein [Pyrococcus kukulkanii]|uniref:Glycosyltransferase RgtA/B/C/D-like domain-containing protein n=1 Tax=Pyrococcus kukulkanii TaxID=1609559 RepID=A0ABV4T4Z3_9EURY
MPILVIVVIYLYKYSIDPFLPLNISLLYDNPINTPAPAYAVFGKILLKITGMSVKIMSIPIFLAPQVVLLISIIKKITHNATILFLSLTVISIFTEGVYFFIHHMGFILFLTFFLIYMLSVNNKKVAFISIIIFSSLNFTSYKLTYLSVLLIVVALIIKRLKPQCNNNKNNILYLLAVYIVLIFAFNKMFYDSAIPVFKGYILYYGTSYGLKNILLSLRQYISSTPSSNYCLNQVCFYPYTYPHRFFGKVGYTLIYVITLFSALYFVYTIFNEYRIRKNINNTTCVLLVFLIAGTILAITYSTIGLFHFKYIFLPSSLVLIYMFSKIYNIKIKRAVGYLLLLSITLAYTETISLVNERIDPFSGYNILTASACSWAVIHTIKNENIKTDVYSRGIYTIFWKINNKESGYPEWMTTKDLAELYAGKLRQGIFILNYNLPWLEVETWHKIRPPIRYRRYSRINYDLIYSSKFLDIIQLN